MSRVSKSKWQDLESARGPFPVEHQMLSLHSPSRPVMMLNIEIFLPIINVACSSLDEKEAFINISIGEGALNFGINFGTGI